MLYYTAWKKIHLVFEIFKFWCYGNTCFRQSIDLYSSVPSPSLNFLGTPTLSRLGSSFLSSSLSKQTNEQLPSLSKPLLPAVADQQLPTERHSSHSLLPPIPSRRSHIKKATSDWKPSSISHEFPLSRKSSYGQAVLNG